MHTHAKGLRHLRAFSGCFIFDDVGGCCAFPEPLPVLDNEMFHSIKPGLSAYADYPETVSSLSECDQGHFRRGERSRIASENKQRVVPAGNNKEERNLK